MSNESTEQIPSLTRTASPSKPDITNTTNDEEKRGIKRPAPTEEIEAITPANKKTELCLSEKPPLSIYEQELAQLNLYRGNFTRENMKKPPWTDYTRTLFAAKSKLHDQTFASGFMRWWFMQHKGMPEPVQPVPRKAWKLYFLKRQKDLGFAIAGKRDQKKRKMVSQEWKEMTEEEQEPYFTQVDQIQEQYSTDLEKYETDLLAWREMKKASPVTTDGQLCNCEFCTGETTAGPSAPVGYTKVPGK